MAASEVGAALLEKGDSMGTITETALPGEVMQPTLETSQSSPAYRRTIIRCPLAWSAVALWLAFIFYWSAQSSLPGFEQSLPDLLLKKGAHIAVFAVLALLTYRALRHDAGHIVALVGAVAMAVGYGALDEFHQSFVAGRNAAALDVLIDTAGATVALATLHYWHNLRLTNLPNFGARQQFHPKGSDFDGIG